MSTHCVIAEFTDRRSTEIAIEVLNKSHYTDDCVSVVTQANDVEDTFADEAKGKAPASPPGEKTTAASTLAGGTLGAVLGTATMMGPMLVAGPLIGMAAGAVGGSLLSAVEGFGVRQDVGRRYEDKVAGGSCLIIVTGDQLKVSEAERILKTCGPESLESFAS